MCAYIYVRYYAYGVYEHMVAINLLLATVLMSTSSMTYQPCWITHRNISKECSPLGTG